MLLNKRQLEKLKEKWWRKDDVSGKCEKPEDQSDGISIQNIGGVFIVIFVGIGMACITLAFEFWYYKFRKTSKVLGNDDAYNNKFTKNNASMKNASSFGSTGGLIDTNSNSTLKARYPPAGNFRARF
jgi:ionotropic glutamate receptor